MILLVDNYDSFAYNVYQQVGTELLAIGKDEEIQVVRNDAVSVAEVLALEPSHIILSPGPGYPVDAGICIGLIKAAAGVVPLFGVCLGHQSICEAFGATVAHAKELMHGKASDVDVDTNSVLFRGLPKRLRVARYHSLAAVAPTMPAELVMTARADDGEVMAVQHRDYPVYGVQFHPESILTELGSAMMRNFLLSADANPPSGVLVEKEGRND
ncbi:MAG: aminodeoxychorismate/anthranilate synthase component II [Propionibacteriaceae bacterium]|jgi:anthranilate synthase component 2|nr:aminodeoxychorismate/anthranilate synthase component II [Propionibacteriaceae bacterium]